MLDIAYVTAHAIWKQPGIDSVTRGTAADPRYRALRRDNFSCAACGLTASPVPGDLWAGLEVHHKDDRTENDDIRNLVTLCPLCHGIAHADLMLQGGAMPGRFLWTDSISQPLLNLVTHVTAVLELLCRKIETGRNVMDEESCRALGMRVQCRALNTALNALVMPPGALKAPDGTDLSLSAARSPGLFGAALGSFVRSSPSQEERNCLAGHLEKLRWFYDWRASTRAGRYAESAVWNFGGQWIREWSRAAALLEQKLDSLGKADSAFQRTSKSKEKL